MKKEVLDPVERVDLFIKKALRIDGESFPNGWYDGLTYFSIPYGEGRVCYRTKTYRVHPIPHDGDRMELIGVVLGDEVYINFDFVKFQTFPGLLFDDIQDIVVFNLNKYKSISELGFILEKDLTPLVEAAVGSYEMGSDGLSPEAKNNAFREMLEVEDFFNSYGNYLNQSLSLCETSSIQYAMLSFPEKRKMLEEFLSDNIDSLTDAYILDKEIVIAKAEIRQSPLFDLIKIYLDLKDKGCKNVDLYFGGKGLYTKCDLSQLMYSLVRLYAHHFENVYWLDVSLKELDKIVFRKKTVFDFNETPILWDEFS